ncbi:glycoside hydrolase family 6 protein [Pseudonocardia sp. TRM90224]|uniref:glycoside hydrolase family 6 protein n=1 Tax=Pseudonocardia sp. TRM90224 TaxID=2812678 RepID=UPI001E5AF2FE|nr:glycoside hydrolase family 6 protein [Pseudonocardia sp. TRM90224]
MPGRALLFVAAFLVAVAGCAAAPPGRPDPTPPPFTADAQPSAGLYVDPDTPAARQAAEWESQGRIDDAAKMRKLAAQPIPRWLTKPTSDIGADVADYVRKATAAGQRPLFVAYNIPGRDCGSFSGGGADDGDDYREWIKEIAANLGDSRALVIVEPDAVPHELDGCVDGDERAGLLSHAIEVLKGAGASVYLDAGNPGFVPDVEELAGALRNSGAAKADGFSLNVANFYPTDEVTRYGTAVSAALGGAHFVIDTSRNGNGRDGRGTINGGPGWCNPPGRAIGQVPSFETGEPLVDAYLWIKRAGASDGECNRGEPAAGQWWPEYALGLVSAG